MERPYFRIEEFAAPVDSSALFMEEHSLQQTDVPGWSFTKNDTLLTN